MTKKQKVAVSIGAGAVVGAAIQWRILSNDVVKRFPEIDEKIVRKAYRNMMLKSFTGQYLDQPHSTDADFDLIFRREVEYLTQK